MSKIIATLIMIGSISLSTYSSWKHVVESPAYSIEFGMHTSN